MTERHLTVRLDAGEPLHYRAEQHAAEEFAAAAAYLAEITIDDRITDDVPPLPCASLWEHDTDQLPYVTRGAPSNDRDR
ncbi:hypothetical protein [Nocardia wallacei]|uniref:hypothetical protein n=1 Tax=Nocardia wallacei TaxID=480035 RepID=UPI0024561B29|nr:hypothetical protein [Nocardia wallacei]